MGRRVWRLALEELIIGHQRGSGGASAATRCAPQRPRRSGPSPRRPVRGLVATSNLHGCRFVAASTGSNCRSGLAEGRLTPDQLPNARSHRSTESIRELAWLKATKSRKVAAMRMYVIGGPGSGKTSLAVALGDRLSVPVVHLDRSLE